MCKRGYIAFSSLLIISVMALAIGISVSLLSISESQMGYAERKGEETLFFVEGCMEDALLKARDQSFTGGILNHPEGSCTIVVEKNGNNWVITAIGSKDGFTKKIKTEITWGRRLILNSWTEIE